MRRWLVALAFGLMLVAPRAFAQECRRTCHIDETRDANGCCIPPPASTAPAPRALPRRCPAGTHWSDSDHACIGRLECPVGSHPEEGHGCVADAVACPAGSRAQEGRCVADVTCPPNARLEGSQCVSDVTCPANTRLEAGHCVSSDVRCPEGTQPREGGGCIGEPVCPAATHFVQDRGCVGEPICAAGAHYLEGRGCVGETVCAPGTHAVEGRGCVDLCEDVAHSRWDPDHGACTCQSGYTAHDGRCEERTECDPGMHRDGDRCVPDVICPYEFQFVQGRGCVDTRLEREERLVREQEEQDAAREAAARARIESRQRAERWTNGPAVQLWGGLGYAYMVLPQYLAPSPCIGSCTHADVVWQNVAYQGGVDFSQENLVLGATYTRIQTTTTTPNGWSISPRSLDLVMLEIGAQSVGAIHTWRLLLAGGYDVIGGNGIVASLAYRSLFNLWRGIFLGFELRATGMFALSTYAGSATAPAPAIGYNHVHNSAGIGGNGVVFLGYSIH